MKHSLAIKGLSSLLIFMQITGCSTIFGRHQDEQSVFFDSDVADVEVTCSGKRAVTPGSIPLKQSKDHICMAEREGYERQVFQIKSGISGSGFAHSTAINTASTGWWTLGIGTGVGWLVDLATGAMKNLKKDKIQLQMKPL